MRCLALAQHIGATGGSVSFACHQLPQEIESRLSESEGIPVLPMPSPAGSTEDAQLLLDHACQQNADWIIVDGQQFSAQYVKQLRQGRKVLLIDDLGHDSESEVDILLNYHHHASSEMYPRTNAAVSLFGLEYFLARMEFREIGTTRPQCEIATNVVISMGGTDPDNLARRALEALNSRPWTDLSVRWMVSPERRREYSIDTNFQMETRHPVRGIEHELGRADLGVLAAGGVCYEAAALGLPAVVITRSEEHFRFMKPLHDLGILELVPYNCGQQQLGELIHHLAHDASRRAAISENARRRVSANGAGRVVEAMARFDQE